MPWFDSFGWWWIFPVIMVVACLFVMRGRMGCMMGGHKQNEPKKQSLSDSSDSALDILNRRYALGEIDKREYEEKKVAILSR